MSWFLKGVGGRTLSTAAFCTRENVLGCLPRGGIASRPFETIFDDGEFDYSLTLYL